MRAGVDWSIPGGTTNVYQVLDNWQTIMGNSTKIDTGFIVLEHDLFEQTVDVATGYILPEALAHQPSFNLTPVVECMGLTLADAYVETNNNQTNPEPSFSSTSVSPSSTGGSGGSGSNSGSGSGARAAAVAPALGSAALAALVGAALLL